MKKIIVPVDFSDHSNYALESAAILAKKYDAEILALHMLEISETILTKGEADLQAETVFFLKLAEQRFTDFLQQDFLKDVKVTPIVKHFKVFTEVNEVAKEHNADLIVMGSHGSSGLKEIFIGSNTEKVVRHSDVPVLVIKNKPTNLSFENVVFASDFSESTVTPYINATKLFDKLGANLHLIYVNTPGDNFNSTSEMEQIVVNFLQKADGNLDKLSEVKYISDYTVEKGILNHANVSGANAIAVATHGRKGFTHFLAGSISEDIANHSSLPVVTFKIK
ncbi:MULTISPECIES: universal stress protein [Olleya]|uniref:Nucleotide-binding universal stress protein, UspA family n=1 Tax=Olleya namhaensis TaxID=1144750 RepID=A0A1I3MMM6_9FLAO|nr:MULTISPECIES: universal stress protein [Olleya]PKG52678.1 universal stress protein [Olleya sp. 1-3]SFI98247.1 Nucleotide-binding universal stress protein, UspA family [Olleya namhaensis]